MIHDEEKFVFLLLKSNKGGIIFEAIRKE